MKKKDVAGIRTKDIKALKKLVKDKKLEILKLKSKMKVGKVKNLKKVKNVRRDVAQILSVIREKELKEKVSRGRKGKSADRRTGQPRLTRRNP